MGTPCVIGKNSNWTRVGSFDARTGLFRHLLTAVIALLSIALVLIVPTRVYWAGLIYFLMGPAHAAFGFARGKRRERIAQPA